MRNENAVKHNTITHGMPLSLFVFAEENTVGIKHNLQYKTDVHSTDKGINNMGGRYTIFTP